MDLTVHLPMKTFKYRYSRYELEANIAIPRHFRNSSVRKREVSPTVGGPNHITRDVCPFHKPHGLVPVFLPFLPTHTPTDTHPTRCPSAFYHGQSESIPCSIQFSGKPCPTPQPYRHKGQTTIRNVQGHAAVPGENLHPRG